MKAQRMKSAKFMPVRAPMTRAPIMPIRMKAYMASAVSRVKNHMAISKLRPRWESGRVLDLAAMLHSQPGPDDHVDREAENGDEHSPFQPDRLALVGQQLGPQVEDRD